MLFQSESRQLFGKASLNRQHCTAALSPVPGTYDKWSILSGCCVNGNGVLVVSYTSVLLRKNEYYPLKNLEYSSGLWLDTNLAKM